MVTKWYKNILKYMLAATTYNSVMTQGTFPSNMIKNVGGTSIGLPYLNFGYSSSYNGFPSNMVYTMSTTGTGFCFQNAETTMVESDENYRMESSTAISTSYVSIASVKAVKRYNSETGAVCIDYYLELRNTNSTPVTIAGVGFVQRVPYASSVSATTATTYADVLFDYTELTTPLTLTNLQNETLKYTIETTWDFEEEEEPEP